MLRSEVVESGRGLAALQDLTELRRALDGAAASWSAASPLPLSPKNAMELEALVDALIALGCPRDKCAEMAAQLDKRARQLAEQKDRSYEEALAHLLSLMRQGWAAKERSND